MVSKSTPDFLLVCAPIKLYDGAKIVETVHNKSPGTKVVYMVSAERPETEMIAEAVYRGASGCVVKSGFRDDIDCLVKTLDHSGCFISPGLAPAVLRCYASVGKRLGRQPRVSENISEKLDMTILFSRAEFKVLSFVGQGFDIADIASCQHISMGTVRNLLSALYRKTGLYKQSQLAVYTLAKGYSDLRDLQSHGREVPDQNDDRRTFA
jgi:DNA-binding NarL/FixJ family response regulator